MNTTRSVLFALLSLGFLAGCGGDETEGIDRLEKEAGEFFEQHFPRGKTIQVHPLFKTMLNDGWTPIDFEIAGPDLLVIFGK
jgi:hypothetical protein